MSRSLKKFWSACDRLQGFGVMKEWETAVKDNEVFAVARDLLVPAGRESEHYPCTNEHWCVCSHKVIHHRDGSIVAVCTCDEPECDTIELSRPDLIVYEPDLPRMFRGLAETLGFEPDVCEVAGLPHITCLGECGSALDRGLPVFYTMQPSRRDFADILKSLALQGRCPSILLTTTACQCDLAARDIARNQRVLIICLEDIVFTSDGRIGMDSRVKGSVEEFAGRAAAKIKADRVLDAAEPKEFEEFNGYHTIILRGEELPHMSDPQAEVIRILHAAYLKGDPEMNQTEIVSKVSISLGREVSEKISRIFRASDPRCKVITSTKRGYYRLNIK